MMKRTSTSTTGRLLAVLVSVLLCSHALARIKTDVVWLINGDRITGEIIQLEYGKVRLDTESMGEIRIDWHDVARIESDYPFQFERTDGTRITGNISEIGDQGEITLTNDFRTITFAHNRVVRIAPIEDSFWDRLKGSMSFGYSFTKASNVAQGNLGIRATHRTAERAFSLDGSTILTSDQVDNATQSSSLRLDMTRFKENRWFNQFFLSFESNDELDLDLRSSFGGGMGRYLQQTDVAEFSLIAGLMATSEKLNACTDCPMIPELIPIPSHKESLEGLLGLSYTRFVFDDPTVDLSVKAYVFPSITESGRTRAQVDINLRWEMISDLFWELNYYNKYDSDPLSGGENNSDYGVVTSLGWSF